MSERVPPPAREPGSLLWPTGGAAALPPSATPSRATPSRVAEPPAGLCRRIVCRLDGILRRWCNIEEFSRAEDGLLRIAIGRSQRGFTFADGTRIERREAIGELHLWNEHVPPLPEHGPDLGWALMFRHRLKRSLRELAAHVERDTRFRSIRAFRGEGVLGSRQHVERLAAMARDWGFEVPIVERRGWASTIGDFWRNLYALGLLWAFNPGSTKRHALRGLRRDEFWITREALIEHYGDSRRARQRATPRQARIRPIAS